MIFTLPKTKMPILYQMGYKLRHGSPDSPKKELIISDWYDTTIMCKFDLEDQHNKFPKAIGKGGLYDDHQYSWREMKYEEDNTRFVGHVTMADYNRKIRARGH